MLMCCWVKPVHQRATFCHRSEWHVALITNLVGTRVMSNHEEDDDTPLQCSLLVDILPLISPLPAELRLHTVHRETEV